MAQLCAQLNCVLVGVKHSGNVGGIARALKNMGINQLRLVAPYPDIDGKATARAANAAGVLNNARCFNTLEAAISDAHFIVATSARPRRHNWPTVDAREAAAKMTEHLQHGHIVSLLFGREDSGLTNDELARAHLLTHIPSDPRYNSLNIVCAAQILAYELYLAAGDAPAVLRPFVSNEAPADAEQFNAFIAHLEQTLEYIDFFTNPQSAMLRRRLRRLFLRAAPTQDEINILRGILSKVQRERSQTKSSHNA